MDPLTLFLCGDVMAGRGIDQILPHPGRPELYEPYVKDARDYVALSEKANGPIPRSADFAYVWGDALEEWRRAAPDLRIVNLETAVTSSDAYWKDKLIHYRMHPANLPCLAAAGIDCCVLANNHVLDWGYPGLIETLETLVGAGIPTAGAGLSLQQAEAPAVLAVAGKGRVLVFAYGAESAGVPLEWGASVGRPGVNLLPDLSDETVDRIAGQVGKIKRPGDVVLVSLHWGGNWGYDVPEEHIAFAHSLIDRAGVHLVHGHSPHHPLGIEAYRNKLILYGCGDFLNDYEGIRGYENFRGDLTLTYFATLDPASGELAGLRMVPLRIRHFRLNRASAEEARWLRDTLVRETAKFSASVRLEPDNSPALEWIPSARISHN